MEHKTERRSCFSKENPRLQTAWDSTSLGLLKTCPRKYQYQMLENWQERDRLHLDFGGAMHKGLETLEHSLAEGKAKEAALTDAIKAALQYAHTVKMRNDDTGKNKQNLVRALVGYVDKWLENNNYKTYILDNGKPAVELSFKIQLPISAPDGTPYILCGHLDRVVRFGDELFIIDCKTSKYQLDQSYFANFNPSNQMTLYASAAKIVLKEDCAGIIIDGIQILVGGERFQRHMIRKPQVALDEWFKDLLLWIRQAEIYAEENHFPMNDTACSMYGGCTFRAVCGANPNVRPHLLKTHCDQRAESDAWNPLIER